MFQTDKIYEHFLKFPSISTDSRRIGKGDLFFALKGPNFNGNEYTLKALDLGASYVIVDEFVENLVTDHRVILVDDVLQSLQALAKKHRSSLNIPVIGITGSNGKTTTKELLGKVFKSRYNSFQTKGNLNNHIGVPLSILSIKLEHEVAIIEMGANHIGEIAFLCEICQPTHGIITNIGKAHLEGFGSLEGVKKGKSELYKYLEKEAGVAFINSNESELLSLSSKFKMQKIFYGAKFNSIPSLRISLINHGNQIEVDWIIEESKSKGKILSQLNGIHNYQNILTSIIVGFYFKVTMSKIAAAIQNYIPSNNRSELILRGTNKFLMDAYNANPSSMKSAIAAFSKYQFNGNKVLILGDMFELGESSLIEHKELYSFCQALDFSEIILVGNQFSAIKDATAIILKGVQELKEWYEKKNYNNTIFLLKGSRGIALESLLK